MSRKALKEQATKIAEYANTCCHRSDGYEKDVMDVVLLALLSARAAALEEAAEACEFEAELWQEGVEARLCAARIRALKEKE